MRTADDSGQAKNFLGEFGTAFDHGPAAGEHEARAEQIRVLGAADLLVHMVKNFFHARLDDRGHFHPRHLAVGPPGNARHIHQIVEVHQRFRSATAFELELLGLLPGRPQTDRHVLRHICSPQPHDGGMANRAVVKHRQIGRAPADVDQCHAHFLFVRRQNRITRRDGFEHQIRHLQPGAADALANILRGRDRARHDVYIDFEAHARHADGVFDAGLIVDDKRLRQYMDDFLIHGNGHALFRRFDHALRVVDRDLVVRPGHGHHRARIHAADVIACDARIDRADARAGHFLRFFNCRANRLHGLFHIDHHPALEAIGGVAAQSRNFERVILFHFGDDRADLGGANIESNDSIHRAVLSLTRACPRPLDPDSASRCTRGLARGWTRPGYRRGNSESAVRGFQNAF